MFICHLVIALSGYVIDKFCEACLKQSQPLHESCLNINQVHGNKSSDRTQLKLNLHQMPSNIVNTKKEIRSLSIYHTPCYTEAAGKIY